MKYLLIVCVVLTSLLGNAQRVIPYLDFNNYFKSMDGPTFRFIEMQQIKEYKAGDNLVAYIDIRGNLRVFDGENKHDLSNMNVQYEVSDNLLVWNVGTTVNMWDNGLKKTLTFFGDNYVVKDNMIVYMDTRWNSINVYWNGKEYPIQTATGTLTLNDSGMIGENIMAYADNGNIFRIFYKGDTYEIGVWNGTINFKSGTDIVAFNDPTTRTFAVFDKGGFVDVEPQWVERYKAGRGFVVYEDVNGNLMLYKDGERTELSSFPGEWDVRDDVVFYQNNGFSYVWYNGETIQAATYAITEYKLKNGVVVFTNLQGGVSAVVEGKLYEITQALKGEYEIYGNSVLVSLFNNSFMVLRDGKITRA